MQVGVDDRYLFIDWIGTATAYAAEKIIVFDKYQNVSAKDKVPIDYELSITSPLPKRDAIMKSKNNKRRLASELSTFTVGDMTITESVLEPV